MALATRDTSLRPRAIAMAAALLLGASACGDSAGPETGADVEGITENTYFDNGDHLGERVTVSATVTDVINPRSFQVGGQDYGDDSLLVLYPEGRKDVQKGEIMQATGTVRQFRYADYVEPHGLVDEGRYDAFRDEEFLLADKLEISAPPEVR